MFEVALIDKKNYTQTGSIGEYSTLDIAKKEADHYNIKIDRHSAYAVVQPILYPKSKEFEYEPSNEEPSSEESSSESSNDQTNFTNRLKLNPIHRDHHRIVPRQNVTPKLPHKQVSTEIPRKQVVKSQIRTEIPPQRNIEPIKEDEPVEMQDDHVLIHDFSNNRYLVLKDGIFVKNMVLYGNGRYDIIKKGDFYNLITERNRLLRK